MEINQKTDLREALIQTSNFGEISEKFFIEVIDLQLNYQV